MSMDDVDNMSWCWQLLLSAHYIKTLLNFLFNFKLFRECWSFMSEIKFRWTIRCSGLQILKNNQKKTDAGGIFNRCWLKNVQTRSVHRESFHNVHNVFVQVTSQISKEKRRYTTKTQTNNWCYNLVYKQYEDIVIHYDVL